MQGKMFLSDLWVDLGFDLKVIAHYFVSYVVM